MLCIAYQHLPERVCHWVQHPLFNTTKLASYCKHLGPTAPPCVCLMNAGYGTSAVSPDTCTACSNGYYSEGPLPRAEMAAQTSASSSQAFAWLAPGLPPPPAPAPAPAPAAAWPDVWPPPWSPERHPASTLQSQARGAGLPSADLVQQTLSTAGSHLQGVQHASTVAGVENTQQRSLQQVDSEFSMPTYSPCTFCGRGCSTGGPGATSPQSCSKFGTAGAAGSPQLELQAGGFKHTVRHSVLHWHASHL